jgi:hypothetical protein
MTKLSLILFGESVPPKWVYPFDAHEGPVASFDRIVSQGFMMLPMGFKISWLTEGAQWEDYLLNIASSFALTLLCGNNQRFGKNFSSTLTASLGGETPETMKVFRIPYDDFVDTYRYGGYCVDSLNWYYRILDFECYPTVTWAWKEAWSVSICLFSWRNAK